MFSFDSFELYQILIWTAVFLIAHWPSNWIIGKIIKKRKPDPEEPADQMGALIGTLERILTVILVHGDSYTAVGFVIAVKSIARYKRVQEEKAFAEYFLAGTMLSLIIALVLGILAKKLIEFLS